MENDKKDKPIEFWSCDPASIKPWTEEDKEKLNKALDKIFGKDRSADDSGLKNE